MSLGFRHAKSVTVADWNGTVTVANSTGGTTTAAASDLARPSDWNSDHAYNVESGFYEPFAPQNTNSTLSAPGIGTWYLHPVIFAHGADSGQLNIMVADAAGFLGGTTFSQQSSGSITKYQTLRHVLALYERGTGTASTRLESRWSSDFSMLATWERRWTVNGQSATLSNYISLSFPGQWDDSGGVTYSSTAQSGTRSTSTTTTSGNYASSFGDSLITGALAYVTGSKFLPFGFATSMRPDNFWLAHMYTSSSSSTGTNYSPGVMWSTQSLLFNLEFVGQAYKRFGQSVSNSSTMYQHWHGSVATTSSNPFANIATSDMRNFATNHRLYWNYIKTTY